MFQIGLAVFEPFGKAVLGKVGLIQRELEVTMVGDFAGVGHCTREFNKCRVDLFCRFHIELIRIKLQPIRVADSLAGLEAKH